MYVCTYRVIKWSLFQSRHGHITVTLFRVKIFSVSKMASAEGNEKWIIGVVLGLLGSIAINTGNNIQSLGLKDLKDDESLGEITIETDRRTLKTSLSFSYNQSSKSLSVEEYYDNESNQSGANDDDAKGNVQNEIKDDESYSNHEKTPITITSKKHPASSTKWIIGTVVFVSGSLLNFASYAFAAQSMLASLESIQFVTNLLFGKFLLGTHVTRQMYFGTFLTVFGTIVAVQFSSKVTLDLNTAEIKELYLNPIYMIYLCAMVMSLFLLDMIYRYYEQRQSIVTSLKYTKIMLPLTYSIWSALFGTQSVVQAKVLAELLAVQSTGQEDIFHSWFTYFTILLWLGTVVVWLKRLNDALSIFDPIFIIPMLQCSFIFFAIVSGGIFFKEFNEFTSGQWFGFCFGVLIMFCGLMLLTPSEIDTIEYTRDDTEMSEIKETDERN